MMTHDSNHLDTQFDRLVDGELPAADRRALLSSLDQQDDGWRRCALAFLESQAWGRELRGLVQESTTTRNQLAKPMTASNTFTHWLALAAGLLAAFTLGWAIQNHLAQQSLPGGAPLDVIANVAPPAPPEATVAEEAGVVPPADVADALTMWVRNEQGRPEAFSVPLVDAETLDRQLGLQFRSGISDDVRQQLENDGYRIKSRRRYAPLWIDGGRPLVLPVEDTQIVPVRRQVY